MANIFIKVFIKTNVFWDKNDIEMISFKFTSVGINFNEIEIECNWISRSRKGLPLRYKLQWIFAVSQKPFALNPNLKQELCWKIQCLIFTIQIYSVSMEFRWNSLKLVDWAKDHRHLYPPVMANFCIVTKTFCTKPKSKTRTLLKKTMFNLYHSNLSHFNRI